MKVVSIFILSFLPLILGGCGDKEETQVANQPETNDLKSLANNMAASLKDDSILGDGLQATLQLAAKKAVEELSKPGSFADTEALRIRLPDSFAPVESTLKKLGQEKLLDNFTDSLNEAARSSVAASPQILAGAISGMKVEDALSIWKGGTDAATRYLETHTRSQISEKMLPIISKQTEASGGTRYFKQITDLLQPKKGGLLGNIASLAGIEIPSDFNLDDYVSEKALDGLYATLATEEAKIRENPAARTTDLVKNAFKYFSEK